MILHLPPKFSVIKKSEGDIYVIRVLRYQTFPHAVKTKAGKVYCIRVVTTVREATSTELALLFETAKEEIIKKPKLELLLVDSEGSTTEKIDAQPTFTKIKKIKSKARPAPRSIFEGLKTLPIIPYGEREPPQDLVPIGIEVSNTGEAPAYGIRVFLHFPKSCELFEQHDVIGGLRLFVSKFKPTSGGFFVDRDNSEAWAWIDTLGNDLIMRKFDKVYIRFPPEEQKYKMMARITQHNFPPEDFEFKVTVKPDFKEKIEYIYGE